VGFRVLVGVSVDDPSVVTEDQAVEWVLRNIPEPLTIEIVGVTEEDEDTVVPET